MARKKNKIDMLLKRAEKAFKAGNFAEALEKYTKAQRKLNRSDIEKKLVVCRRETETEKRKELIEQGHTLEQEHHFSNALDSFKQAADLLEEPWLTQKIQVLESLIAARQAAANARAAEDSGEHQTAGSLFRTAALKYLDAREMQEDDTFLPEAAVCLVKAQDFSKALELFGKVSDFDDRLRYHYGFALARTGDYENALEQWQDLDSVNPSFLAQRSRVLTGAIDRIYQDLTTSDNRIEETYQRADRLLTFTRPVDDMESIKLAKTLLDVCKISFARIKWEAADYETVANCIETLTDDPELIRLKGAALYHLSENREEYRKDLSMCWMDAVFTATRPENNTRDTVQTDQIRNRLIHMARMRINTSGQADPALKCFDIHTRLMTDLQAIARTSAPAPGICAPWYAAESGRSEIILERIRENKTYFRDEQHYLETGGYYSKAGLSLLEMKIGDMHAALKGLDTLELLDVSDEFSQYVQDRIRFKYGLMALEAGDKNFLDYFSSTHLLFETAPAIERRFSDKLLKYEGDHLLRYEALGVFLYKKRPSKLIRRTLSILMARAAIRRYNADKLNEKQFKATILKSLDLDPENEFSRQLLEESNMELETEVMLKAMSHHKLQKAARIAAQSEHPETRDHFFDFGEKIAEEIQNADMPIQFKQLELKKLQDACNAVDPFHPLLDQIDIQLGI